ncbi:MAG: hypothetical protein N2037_05660 [Acidimicrobiales bacterium]|nr:hypothetical protein [Acidimicrobiales bacterium]
MPEERRSGPLAGEHLDRGRTMGAIDDERIAAGVDHLQAAALEMIAAARSFLDLLEDLVADRDKMADVVAAVGDAARSASRAAREVRPVRHSAGKRRKAGGDGDDVEDEDDYSSVQRIRVS